VHKAPEKLTITQKFVVNPPKLSPNVPKTPNTLDLALAVAEKKFSSCTVLPALRAPIKIFHGYVGEGIEKTYENANTLFSLNFLAAKISNENNVLEPKNSP
jgi:hypothetical protein